MFPVGKPIPNISADKQITGEALYTDDMPTPPGGLYAAFVFSQKAYARVLYVSFTITNESWHSLR
jgi:xanthine dehydrogenase/oxidase